MNDPGAPSLDWSAILDRAHRRVILSLALAGAIGAVGAVLLLGGGVATRAAIKKDEGQPPPSHDQAGQPNLVISAVLTEVVVPGDEEGGEGEEREAEGEELEETELEVSEEGEFTVKNESSIDAEAFTVVATTEEGPQESVFDGLSAGDEVTGTFRCPVGDQATLEIESRQIDEPDTETIDCAEPPTETTESTETTEPTETTESTGGEPE